MIKFKDFEVGRFPAAPNLITQIPILGASFQAMVKERVVVTEAALERCYITGSEGGRKRPQAKECG